MRLYLLALCVFVAAQASAATQSAGRLRVCLAPPSAQLPGISGDDAAAAVRDAFKSYLTGPSLEAEVLSARLPSQAHEEAKQKQCRFVLYTTAVQERKQSSGLLGRIAAGAMQSGASQVAANTGSASTRVLASAAAGGAASTYYGSFTQSSDRLTLTTRVEFPDGNVLARGSETRKAKSDREDLLTPLVERMAGQVVTAMSGVKP
jgi:sulfate adenylyltransferase subunit 1 (EFTu-like GTPase family)